MINWIKRAKGRARSVQPSGDRLAEVMDLHQRRPIGGRLSCHCFGVLSGAVQRNGVT